MVDLDLRVRKEEITEFICLHAGKALIPESGNWDSDLPLFTQLEEGKK